MLPRDERPYWLPDNSAFRDGWPEDPDHPVAGMHLKGWIQPSELTWLSAKAATMGSIVEIGSFRGRSSYALAQACPGWVYCVDPWTDEVFADWQSGVGSQFDNVVPVRHYSPEAGELIPDPVDMVFVDGAHDYDSVAEDIMYWQTRARVLLCGHDYTTVAGAAFPGVRQAVEELVPSFTVIPDTWIWSTAP
jgi:hypothetical protein